MTVKELITELLNCRMEDEVHCIIDFDCNNPGKHRIQADELKVVGTGPHFTIVGFEGDKTTIEGIAELPFVNVDPEKLVNTAEAQKLRRTNESFLTLLKEAKHYLHVDFEDRKSAFRSFEGVLDYVLEHGDFGV